MTNIIKTNYHVIDQIMKNVSEKHKAKQLHHFIGAWMMAGRTENIFHGDDANIIFGDKKGHFLYKRIDIPNFVKYLKDIGIKSTNLKYEREAIRSLCELKGDLIYTLEDINGDKYTVEKYATQYFKYEKHYWGNPGRPKGDKYDLIEVGGYEGVVDNAWSAISTDIIPYLGDLSVYGLRLLLALQLHVRRNYPNTNTMKLRNKEFIFRRNKEDIEKMIGMDKLMPIQRRMFWVDIIDILTKQSKMIRYFWVPNLIVDGDDEGNETLRALKGKKLDGINNYMSLYSKKDWGANWISQQGDLDVMMSLIVPGEKWLGYPTKKAHKIEGKTQVYLEKVRP